MKFHKLGLLNKSQKGLTALELIMALAVSGIITGGITTTFYYLITGSARASNHMTLVKQVQNAGYWVSSDAQAAQDADDNPVGGELLVLTWTDWDNEVTTVTYTLNGTQLWRDDGAQQVPVAQFIDPAGTSFEFNDTNGDNIEDTLIFEVTATIGSGLQQQTETRVYKVVPRPR
jgi:prepilin-type N-terminal cleavage/methylation domain-containing protein